MDFCYPPLPQSMLKTLFVSDLDGTLLDAQANLPASSREALNLLIAHGLPFTVATARSHASAMNKLQGLHVKLPMVEVNGTFLTSPEGKILEAALLSQSLVEKTLETIQEAQLFPLVYWMDSQTGKAKVSWITGQETPGIRCYLDERQGDPRLTPVPSWVSFLTQAPYYITVIGPKAELDLLAERFLAEGKIGVTYYQNVYHPEEYWLELGSSKATKASGVLRLKQRLGGISVTSFGDNANDKPMFSVSDHCCAVENARDPELLAMADSIIPPPEQFGVAKFLWKMAGWPEELFPQATN